MALIQKRRRIFPMSTSSVLMLLEQPYFSTGNPDGIWPRAECGVEEGHAAAGLGY